MMASNNRPTRNLMALATDAGIGITSALSDRNERCINRWPGLPAHREWAQDTVEWFNGGDYEDCATEDGGSGRQFQLDVRSD
jgi:hypothetical protein